MEWIDPVLCITGALDIPAPLLEGCSYVGATAKAYSAYSPRLMRALSL